MPGLQDFNFENFFNKFRWQIAFFLLGVTLVGIGAFYLKNQVSPRSSKIEVLESMPGADSARSVVVEVSGAVESSGVYKLETGSRVEDALIAAGGVSVNADRDWMEKVLNRAAKLVDGQKLYIPKVDEQTDVLSAEKNDGNKVYQSENENWGSVRININTATAKELESMWGIGPVTAQNIIEQRPYSSVEELLSRKVVKSNVYERNKDILTVY